MSNPPFSNPFRPGAGHAPPYLAGRDHEKREFARLLEQPLILENLVLTGLRGVGKTVLLDALKPMAQQLGWLWVGTDLSESASISEESVAIRLIADLSTATSGLVLTEKDQTQIGFEKPTTKRRIMLDFPTMGSIYSATPGLVADKLKAVLELAWQVLSSSGRNVRGLIFAYDEAQNLGDHAAKDQYPLSLLLDVFQSVQRKGVAFMLALAGLPTLFPKLVEARTFAERMFRVVFLDRLSATDSRDAILKPIADASCPVRLSESSVKLIVARASGYPYFLQFICREVYDAFLANLQATGKFGLVPIDAITRKLDSDFFAGRWARVTDRQRDLLVVIARIERADEEFAVQEIVESSKDGPGKPFSSSHANQMLVALSAMGLAYKNRHGKYSFAVPLFGEFVLRQMGES
ncbi:MAG: ATP-binding protein [Deltaproteobacteria bacterium]|nr:ATP-binding protein [Deltaproteobacteria bacterium]